MHTKRKSFASVGLLTLLSVGWTPLFGQVAPAPSASASTTTDSPAPTTAAPSSRDDTPIKLDTYVVNGLQSSLASAEEIKESNQQIVDAIVASDVDKLPDMNASYALSRIPGVQLAHTFSGLGGNGAVTIQGLNQIVSTLDGHEVITPGGIANGTAGVGVGQRTFDYSQIPSALIEEIDVYKTSAANQIDGGLGGLIDVRMRKPFDFPMGLDAGGTVGTSYSVLKEGDNQNYDVYANAVYKTAIGKIGFLVSISQNTTPWREDGVGIGNPTPNPTVTTGQPNALTTTSYTDTASYGEFKTEGYNAVFQWQPVANLELHVGYNPNKWRNTQDEDEFSVATPITSSVAGSGMMFPGSTTAVESATFTNVTGTAYGLIRDLQNQLNISSAGGKLTLGDLVINFDGDHYTSSNRFYNNLVFASINVPQVRYSLGGTIPSVTYSGVSLEDPTKYALSQVDYRLYPSNTVGNAEKIDAEYNVNKSILTKILFGARYATTTSNNEPTGLFLGAYNIPASANSLSNYAPNLWQTTPVQNIFSGYSEPQFQGFLVSNTAVMRNANALFQDYNATNTPATSATVNPLSLFAIKETTDAFYLMPQFAGTMFGLNFDGNIGLRMVRTEENTGGFAGATAATAVPLDLKTSYNDWLPSFNYRLKITDTLFVRAAASKTITRPPFGELSPSLTLNANPVNPNLNSGSQGNPNLQPIRANSYDVAVEWYPEKSSVFYGTVFRKDVTGFIGSFSQPETYSGVTYLIQTYANLNPATIDGYEIGFQHFFTSLPAPFDGFGVQANYTYVYSTTPTTVAGAGAPVNAPLTNLSKQAYNVVAMYEKGPFSARVAYNYRSSFVTGFAYYVSTGLLTQALGGYGDLDASVNYNITKNIEISIQGVNLSNTLRYQYYGSKQFPSNIYTDGALVMSSITFHY